MSRAKNHELTYLHRHRQDLVGAVHAIGPGERKEFFFETHADAERFRQRLYSYVPAYYGYQKFVVPRDGATVTVINLAGEVYDKNKGSRTVRGDERENRNEGGERE